MAALPEAVPASIAIDVEGRVIALDLRINTRARRISLRLPADGGRPTLTLPSARQLRQGIGFAEARGGWLAERLAVRAALARPFLPGVAVPVDGRPLLLLAGDARRVQVGDGWLAVPGDDPALFSARVERWLKAEARRVLTADTLALAGAHGMAVAGVRVGDPVSRWGSCGGDGRIAYSWRLLLAPPGVRASVVAHEVAHLVHRNHGPAFWALAHRLLGGSHGAARAWLRQHGPALHGWGVASEG